MSFEPRDHVALALARLPHQYRGAAPSAETNTQKVIRALLSPAAALEQAMRDVLFQTLTENAVGVQLTEIGELVGRPREGVTDDNIYRRYVMAQITANNSDGLIEDILTIATLVVNNPAATFDLRNQGAAAYTLEVSGIAVPDAVATVLIELLLRGTAGGVRPILEYSTAAPSSVLRWDTQGVWDTGVWAAAIDKET